MKNKRLISYAFLSTLLIGQVAFADSKVEVITPTVSNDVISEITADLSKELAKEISKEEVAAATQDYQVEDFERAQPRRSALFLHILDSVVKGSTLAKADMPAQHKTQLSVLFSSDGTLL